MSQEKTDLLERAPVPPSPVGAGIPVWIPWTFAALLFFILGAVQLHNRVLSDRLADLENSRTALIVEKALLGQQISNLERRNPLEGLQIIPMRPGAELQDGGGALVLLDEKNGRARLELHGLSPAPEGQEYQLWLQSGGGEAPVRLVEISVPESGKLSRSIKFERPVTAPLKLRLTLEPAGEAASPQGADVLVGE